MAYEYTQAQQIFSSGLKKKEDEFDKINKIISTVDKLLSNKMVQEIVRKRLNMPQDKANDQDATQAAQLAQAIDTQKKKINPKDFRGK